MKSRLKLMLRATLVLLCVAGLLPVLKEVRSRLDIRREANIELRRFASNVYIGDTKQRITKLVKEYKYLSLLQNSGTSWVVQTPIEIDANNWDLWIEFDNSSVKSLKVRLHDSENIHPKSAPPDRFKNSVGFKVFTR